MEDVVRIIALCFVPTIIIWTSKVLHKMDRGEEVLIDKIEKWIRTKLDIYYDEQN